jgi:hypothetical protein
MDWRSQLLWSNLSDLKLEFQPENLKTPSEDPILQSQTTGVRSQRIDPPYYLAKKFFNLTKNGPIFSSQNFGIYVRVQSRVRFVLHL